MYSNYAFHPPQCPILSYEEFLAVIRNDDQAQSAENGSKDEPLWTQPSTWVLREDIPLESWKPTSESPLKAKSSKPPKQETVLLVQASFRFDPNPGVDAEAYLAAGNNSETTNASARGANYKEHDMIWRSVGLNFSRWIKAQKAKMKPKVDAASNAAGEAERPSKRRKAETGGSSNPGIPYTPGASTYPGPRPPYNDSARASVLARPLDTITPEQRRRQIMGMW